MLTCNKDHFKVTINKKKYPISNIVIWTNGDKIFGKIDGDIGLEYFIYETSKSSFYITLFWLYFCVYIKPQFLDQLEIQRPKTLYL